MKIALVTLFPEMFRAITEYGVTGRAVDQGLVELAHFNPRDFATDKHQTVDDRPYGGGPGMVMRCEPLSAAIKHARLWVEEDRVTDAVSEGGKAEVVYLSPQGAKLNHKGVVGLVKAERPLILLCGRYEGIDERLIELEVDRELSIGDYVLSGGELPAMVLIDALIRQTPGSLGHQDSASEDSFATGLLDCPHYTRPEVYEESEVPPVLLSGNHAEIEAWRLQQSLHRTRERRPDILESDKKDESDPKQN